ncbi:MAG TPA: hypothetical protein VI338_04370 [Nitrososphaera sp.]|jgi:hypothetical protein|nr:hypothetical protein [Nitrososphaera sp.]
MKDRASAALANLQRKAYAMSILRSRIESRIDIILRNGAEANSTQELSRLLELVKNGEMILKEVSDKVESARYLEEFVYILNGATESVNEIKGDVEELVPMAEAALGEMQDAISHVSKVLLPETREQIDPSILAQISAEMAVASKRRVAELAAEQKAIDPGQVASPEETQEKLEEVAI